MIKKPLKAGIKFNGTDILELDPFEVKDAINSLPKNERDLVRAMIKSKIEPPAGRTHIPDDYAKEYGRPSITEVPYMCSENDGYPYLGGGHSPVCDGNKSYSVDIYSKNDICWCMWASKTTRSGPLWEEYLNKK